MSSCTDTCFGPSRHRRLIKASVQEPTAIVQILKNPESITCGRFELIIIAPHASAAPPSCFDAFGPPMASCLVNLSLTGKCQRWTRRFVAPSAGQRVGRLWARAPRSLIQQMRRGRQPQRAVPTGRHVPFVRAGLCCDAGSRFRPGGWRWIRRGKRQRSWRRRRFRCALPAAAR